MSHTNNAHKTTEKSNTDININDENQGKSVYKGGSRISCTEESNLPSVSDNITCDETESYTYAVTVSKKSSTSDTAKFCSDQKSFISIHSTDQPCLFADVENAIDLDECNVEVLSLNEVFPSTSEDSLSNEEESPVKKKKPSRDKNPIHVDRCSLPYVPTNSKSATMSDRLKEIDGENAVCSDFNIPKNTLYVVGSNPGEPKMSYQDPPKKMSKSMKKFLRNVDKYKNDSKKGAEKTMSYATMRGILKDGRCDPECTGDSTLHVQGEYMQNLLFTMDFEPHENYTKQSPDKNVSFNTQVHIFHFTGDICVGQSIETLSKEKDQQERNSELRRTFLTKYNELWPTQK